MSITALLELHDDRFCNMDKPISSSALVMALAAEYVIQKINNNQTNLSVPSIAYSKLSPPVGFGKSWF